MQSDIELWLNGKDDINEDVLVINGDITPEVKFACAERFTMVVEHADNMVNNNQFYPRILLTIAGSIGAGLDSPDLYTVCRAGLSPSIFELAQELGQCGRGCSNQNGIVIDNIHLLLTLDDFI